MKKRPNAKGSLWDRVRVRAGMPAGPPPQSGHTHNPGHVSPKRVKRLERAVRAYKPSRALIEWREDLATAEARFAPGTADDALRESHRIIEETRREREAQRAAIAEVRSQLVKQYTGGGSDSRGGQG